MKIAHVGVKVSNLEKSIEFYEKILALKLCGTHENERLKIAFMESDNCVVELLEYLNDKEKREAGVVDHIAFIVDDIYAEIIKLKENNVETIFDKPRPFMQDKIFFFKGPDGERLELIQRGC